MLDDGAAAVSQWPNGAPGSVEAFKRGCTCAVLENGRGLGRGGDGAQFGWWITEGCPVHAPEIRELASRPGMQQEPITKWSDEPDPSAKDIARLTIREAGELPSTYLDAPDA